MEFDEEIGVAVERPQSASSSSSLMSSLFYFILFWHLLYYSYRERFIVHMFGFVGRLLWLRFCVAGPAAATMILTNSTLDN